MTVLDSLRVPRHLFKFLYRLLVDHCNAHPDDAPALRLISYWNRATGTRFALVLKNYFSDEAAARNQLEDLPSEMFPTVEIISLWDEHTVFFADPFFGKKPLLKNLRVKN